MSWEIDTGDDRSAPAITDLSLKQFCIVKDDGAGNMAIAAAATDVFLGILQGHPKGAAGAARVSSYRPVGVSKVVTGAAVPVVGCELTSDAQGRAVPAVAGNNVIGIAREASAGAGVVIACDLRVTLRA